MKKIVKSNKKSNKLNNPKTFRKKLDLIENIAKFCSKCGAPYKPKDVNIVQETPSHSVLHFKCSDCGSDYIANYSPPMHMVNKIPLNTDLNPVELVKFMKIGEQVTVDDVLHVYEILAENNK